MSRAFRLAGTAVLLLAAAAPPARSEAGRPPEAFDQPPAAGRREPGRDPFRRPDAAPEAERPPGLAGVRILEAVVRGVLRFAAPEGGEPEAATGSREAGLAILESASGEGFVAAPGARLMDGTVGRVRDDGVLFFFEGDAGRTAFRPLAAPAAGQRGPP